MTILQIILLFALQYLYYIFQLKSFSTIMCDFGVGRLVFMCKCMSLPMYKQTSVQIACAHIFMKRPEFGAISSPKLLSTLLLR